MNSEPSVRSFLTMQGCGITTTATGHFFRLVWSPICAVLVMLTISACGDDKDYPVSAGRWRNHASGGMYVGTRPVVSPDGFSIVYSTPATGHGDIYLFDRRNGKNLRLTSDPEYDGYAFFSNAGKIVFIREKDGIGHIWVMNADGSRQKQLTDGLTDDGVPSSRGTACPSCTAASEAASVTSGPWTGMGAIKSSLRTEYGLMAYRVSRPMVHGSHSAAKRRCDRSLQKS